MAASGAATLIVINLQSEGCKFGLMQVGTFAPGNAVCSICINIQLAVFISRTLVQFQKILIKINKIRLVDC